MATADSFSIMAELAEGGRIVPLSSAKAKALAEWRSRHAGHKLHITYELMDSKASGRQFRYLFGYVYKTIHEFLVESGYPEQDVDIETVDATFMNMFASETRADVFTGEIVKVLRRKRDFSVRQMREYIDAVVRHCSQELGLVLHTPEEYWASFGLAADGEEEKDEDENFFEEAFQ